MRNSQAGTSVLAALVFVAIFVLFISGYKIASQGPGGQAAAVASAIHTTYPDSCTDGALYTVHAAEGVGAQTLNCFVPDPADPSAMIPGPDNGKKECTEALQYGCGVRYCPPPSFVTDNGTCFLMTACEQGENADTCVRSSIQNASQPEQAAGIIAARLLTDKGETQVRASTGGIIALADTLTETGRSSVTSIIEETANAADADEIREIAEELEEGGAAREASGPVAQMSCQPKIAEAGMQVAIAFGCVNSIMSSSEQFSTGGRLWGATEVRLDAGLPNGVMTYGIACTAGARTSVATCDVHVQKPFALFSAQDGMNGNVSFGWVTRAMDTCSLSFTDNEALDAQMQNPLPQSGAATVTGVPQNADAVLTCTTVGGEVRKTGTTVNVAR